MNNSINWKKIIKIKTSLLISINSFFKIFILYLTILIILHLDYMILISNSKWWLSQKAGLLQKIPKKTPIKITVYCIEHTSTKSGKSGAIHFLWTRKKGNIGILTKMKCLNQYLLKFSQNKKKNNLTGCTPETLTSRLYLKLHSNPFR